jgi:hypothetical protein
MSKGNVWTNEEISDSFIIPPLREYKLVWLARLFIRPWVCLMHKLEGIAVAVHPRVNNAK